MREIGSEFWDVDTCAYPNSLFPKSTQWYLSGRSALQAIIAELGWAKTVSVPAWCCDSMVKPFVDARMEVKFYPIYPDHGLTQEIDTDADVLFVMDYFGYTKGNAVSHPCIIRDTTHSIFSGWHVDADYFFGSLRKWCGVWTGGYAWAKDKHRLREGMQGEAEYICLRSEAMALKNCYINGLKDMRGKPVTDKHYLDVFKEAEERLEKVGIAAASNRDIELARSLDVDRMKTQRRENAAILMKAFPDMLVFPELNEQDCPMFVPILVPDGKRDLLRKYLVAKGIYCPIHWPVSKYHKVDKKSATLYIDSLSLVCDQRYSREDMDRIVDTIHEFMEDC